MTALFFALSITSNLSLAWTNPGMKVAEQPILTQPVLPLEENSNLEQQLSSETDSAINGSLKEQFQKKKEDIEFDNFETPPPNNGYTQSQGQSKLTNATASGTSEILQSQPKINVTKAGSNSNVTSVRIRSAPGLLPHFYIEDLSLMGSFLGDMSWDILPSTLLESVAVFPTGFPYLLGGSGVSGGVSFRYCYVKCQSLFPLNQGSMIQSVAIGSYGNIQNSSTIRSNWDNHSIQASFVAQSAEDNFPIYNDNGTPENRVDDFKDRRRNNDSHGNSVTFTHGATNFGPWHTLENLVLVTNENRAIPYSIRSERRDRMDRSMIILRNHGVILNSEAAVGLDHTLGMVFQKNTLKNFNQNSLITTPNESESLKLSSGIGVVSRTFINQNTEGELRFKIALEQEFSEQDYIYQKVTKINGSKTTRRSVIPSAQAILLHRYSSQLFPGEFFKNPSIQVLAQGSTQSSLDNSTMNCLTRQFCPEVPKKKHQLLNTQLYSVTQNFSNLIIVAQFTEQGRLPFTSERFGNASGLLPNKDLVQEKSSVYEIALHTKAFSLTGYKAKDQNLILPKQVSPVAIQYQNLSSAERWGLSSQVGLSLAEFMTLLLTYDYLITQQYNSKHEPLGPLPFSPTHSGQLSVLFDLTKQISKKSNESNSRSQENHAYFTIKSQSAFASGSQSQFVIERPPIILVGGSHAGALGSVGAYSISTHLENLMNKQDATVKNSLGETYAIQTIGYRSYPPSGRTWKLQVSLSY